LEIKIQQILSTSIRVSPYNDYQMQHYYIMHATNSSQNLTERHPLKPMGLHQSSL